MMGESFAVNATDTVDHYENFPVASWLCPPRVRGAVVAIYRFARCADDLADEGDVATDVRLDALARYRRALTSMNEPDASLRIERPWQPIFLDLKRQVDQHHLPLNPLHDLISAFEQDVPNPIHVNRAALLDYCNRSANPVGRLLLHLYGVSDATSLRQSDAICSALQLTNFWQDLSIDLPRGRCYLPEEELRQHNLTKSLHVSGDTPASRALVTGLVGWTRRLMLQGAPLAWRVPGRAGWELRLVVQGGLRILHKIEQSHFNALTARPTLARADAVALVWHAIRMRHAHTPSTEPTHLP